MQTFRMTRELIAFLKNEAAAKGLDLTAYVNRMLDGVRTWFGLPDAASHLLEGDREALKMRRYEYILHVLLPAPLGATGEGPGVRRPRRRTRTEEAVIAAPRTRRTVALTAQPAFEIGTSPERV